MNGHEQIIAMRRAGKAPQFVWISRHEGLPHIATVHIAPDDVPELLDLRFLVGLTAVVEGLDDDPLIPRLEAACTRIARRVICSVGHHLKPYGFESTRITDTEGKMQWPN